jgi:hypothetical protein
MYINLEVLSFNKFGPMARNGNRRVPAGGRFCASPYFPAIQREQHGSQLLTTHALRRAASPRARAPSCCQLVPVVRISSPMAAWLRRLVVVLELCIYCPWKYQRTTLDMKQEASIWRHFTGFRHAPTETIARWL